MHQMKSARRAVGVLFVAGAVLSVTGCQVFMPNTGITETEYTHLSWEKVAPPKPNEPALAASGSILGSKIADKIMGVALKVLANYVDGQLQNLQEQFHGAYTAHVAKDGSLGDVYNWEFVRAVRFERERYASTKGHEPRLSQDVITYLNNLEGDPTAAVDPDDPPTKNGWYRESKTQKVHYQLVTLRLRWSTTPSNDGKAFRIENLNPDWRPNNIDQLKENCRLDSECSHTERAEGCNVQAALKSGDLSKGDFLRLQGAELRNKPTLEIFATEALLPNWDEIKKLLDEFDAGSISEELRRKLVDELSIHLTVLATISYPGDDGKLVEVGQLGGAIKGVWPSKTNLKGGVLAPALRIELDKFDSKWLSNAGSNYNIKIEFAETSRVEDWIKQAREAVQKELTKQS